MRFYRFWRIGISLGMAVLATELLEGAEIDVLDGDRVVFLGGTLFERERLYGELETALTEHFRDRRVVFRNIGWDGDTVFGHARAGGRRGSVFGDAAEGFENLQRHVDRVNPTLVLVAYGAVEAHDGQDKVRVFERGYDRLLRRLSKPDRRFVLLTPLRALAAGIPRSQKVTAQVERLNTLLMAYREGVLSLSKRRGWPVIDLYSATELNEPGMRVNGLHLTQKGYQAMARYIIEAACAEGASGQALGEAAREALGKLIRRKSELFYNGWRPRNNAFVFGERKSEQVPVQLELPQYDRLIAEVEGSIDDLLR